MALTISDHAEMNPNKRFNMEDIHVIDRVGDYQFIGVYDGHGGRQMVEFLQPALLYHLRHELQDTSVHMHIRLERAFLLCDIHAKCMGICYSGATVTVCLIRRLPSTGDYQLVAANAGDGRTVWGASNGRTVTALSHDHNTNNAAEVARIEKTMEGAVHKKRVCGVLAVTKSLGDFCVKDFVPAQPYVTTTTVDAGVIIVACDGVWDVMNDSEAVAFVQKHKDNKETVARKLVEEAIRRGTTDNVTAVVVWLD